MWAYAYVARLCCSKATDMHLVDWNGLCDAGQEVSQSIYGTAQFSCALEIMLNKWLDVHVHGKSLLDTISYQNETVLDNSNVYNYRKCHYKVLLAHFQA